MSFHQLEVRRSEAGILQKTLCERAGVNAATYSQIKKGHRDYLSGTLEKLSAALDALLKEKEQGHG
jgi:transcriptional regulator with XRE-family HTH domain